MNIAISKLILALHVVVGILPSTVDVLLVLRLRCCIYRLAQRSKRDQYKRHCKRSTLHPLPVRFSDSLNLRLCRSTVSALCKPFDYLTVYHDLPVLTRYA